MLQDVLDMKTSFWGCVRSLSLQNVSYDVKVEQDPMLFFIWNSKLNYLVAWQNELL